MANVRQYNTLVTASEVISNSFTNQATDVSLITDNIITIAELAHIKPMLGLDMYEELKTQNHNSTLTSANTTLINDFLKSTLCWFVRFEVMNEISFNTTSSGVMANIDEFSVLATPEQFNMQKQDTLRKAQILMEDMLAYIQHEDQTNDYPLFGKDGDSSMPSSDNATKMGGIIFY